MTLDKWVHSILQVPMFGSFSATYRVILKIPRSDSTVLLEADVSKALALIILSDIHTLIYAGRTMVWLLQ